MVETKKLYANGWVSHVPSCHNVSYQGAHARLDIALAVALRTSCFANVIANGTLEQLLTSKSANFVLGRALC